LTYEAYAKVNLSLEVYGKRADGYHDLRSVVLPLLFADTLTFEEAPADEISTDTGYGASDLIVRAAQALRASAEASAASFGVHVRVVKRIPAGGGLGGGSADAAATLRALNELWKLNRMPEELAEIGAGVGSDVPALVLAQHYREPILMEGRGERVSRITDIPAVLPAASYLVLVYPGVSASTAEVYARCTPRDSAAIRPRTPVNDLQAAACAIHPEIASALAALVVSGASGVSMSGSGSVVFGFAENERAAENIAEKMRSLGCTAWITRPLTTFH